MQAPTDALPKMIYAYIYSYIVPYKLAALEVLTFFDRD